MLQKSLRAPQWLPFAGALVVLPLAFGCPAKKDAPKAKAETSKPAKTPAVAKAKVPSGQRADPTCMADWAPTGAATARTAGDRTFSQTGTQLVETSKDDGAKAVIGVLANIKENTPENLKNIAAALAYFKTKNVDSIVVVGDLGETQAQIEAAMQPIVATGLAVFTVVGNREKRSDYAAALKTLSAANPNVIDLNQARLAKLDDVALVSVPGYYDKAYIHAEDGCQYFAGDLEASKPAVKAAAGTPVVLISHGPPRQEGSVAIDRTLEEANVGDANLTKFIEETGIKFGVFSNIQEAGGRATDPSGKSLIKPGVPSDALFLNPGAIDAVSWQMNDGSRSLGMASVLTIENGKASYEVFALKDEG